MRFAVAVVARTPLPVWFVLALLLWQGVAGLRPRTQGVGRVMLLPLAFVIWGVVPLGVRAGSRLDLIGIWAVGAAALFPLGVRRGPRLLAVDRAAGTVTRAGSAVPLLRNLAIFILQYGLALGVALGGAGWLMMVGRGVSGATAGYFGGWALATWRQYRGSTGDDSGGNTGDGSTQPGRGAAR